MVDCPRCGEESYSGEHFCGYCGWSFTDGSNLCATCNKTLKLNEECYECVEYEEDVFVSTDPEDWYYLAGEE